MTMPGAYDPTKEGSAQPKKPDGTFTPSSYQLAKDAAQKNENDYATALAVLQEAVKSFGPNGAPDDLALQKRAQAAWLWITADDWKP